MWKKLLTLKSKTVPNEHDSIFSDNVHIISPYLLRDKHILEGEANEKF